MNPFAPGRHAAVIGPTASGKSALALAWARRAGDVEIVSVDSMQVYRGMDIGTATPTAAERASVPHHLIDLVEPSEDFTVSAHQAAAREAIAGIEERGNRALLVGGTGLHLRAIIDDLDIPGQYPEVAAQLDDEPDTATLHARLSDLDPLGAGRIDAANRRRVLRALEVTVGSGRAFSSFGPGLEEHPPTPFALIGVWLPRQVVRQRIIARYEAQVAAGFVDEVARLHGIDRRADDPGRTTEGQVPPLSRTARQALGYREIHEHLLGDGTLDAALERAIIRTRQFARRQRMWFRRDPRIRWIAGGADLRALAEQGDVLGAA